jgi:hypothetical protein
MENNQHLGNGSNNQPSNHTIPPVVPTPPAPRSSEDFRRQWRDHRACRMAIGLIVAVLVAIIIFAVGFMAGRLSSRHPAYGVMNSREYSQGMRRTSGTSGMNQMQMNGGNASQSMGTPGMTVPTTPSASAPSSTTTPVNQ